MQLAKETYPIRTSSSSFFPFKNHTQIWTCVQGNKKWVTKQERLNWILGWPLRHCIKGPLSIAEDEIKVEFMELIRSIPLAQYYIQLDKLIWPNSNGHYTVKETSKFIYTSEGIQFDKVDGIGFGKPHIHKKFKFLYGNAPIIEYYPHVPLLLTTNMVLAFSVFNV